jgi:hypothetical protein
MIVRQRGSCSRASAALRFDPESKQKAAQMTKVATSSSSDAEFDGFVSDSFPSPIAETWRDLVRYARRGSARTLTIRTRTRNVVQSLLVVLLGVLAAELSTTVGVDNIDNLFPADGPEPDVGELWRALKALTKDARASTASTPTLSLRMRAWLYGCESRQSENGNRLDAIVSWCDECLDALPSTAADVAPKECVESLRFVLRSLAWCSRLRLIAVFPYKARFAWEKRRTAIRARLLVGAATPAAAGNVDWDGEIQRPRVIVLKPAGEALDLSEWVEPVGDIRVALHFRRRVIPEEERTTLSAAEVVERSTRGAHHGNLLGRSLDRQAMYLIGRSLGRGALGETFRARRIQDGADVALKWVCSDIVSGAGELRRLAGEALSANTQLASVCLPYRVVDVAGDWFLESPFLPRSLLGVLRHEPPSERRCWELARLLAEALSVLNAAGLHHGNLKLSNVFLRKDGSLLMSDIGVFPSAPFDEFGLFVSSVLDPSSFPSAFGAPEDVAARDLWGYARMLHGLKLGRDTDREPPELPGEGVEGTFGEFLRWISGASRRSRPTFRLILASLTERDAEDDPQCPKVRGDSLASRVRVSLDSRSAMNRLLSSIEFENARRSMEAESALCSLRKRHVRAAWLHLREDLTLGELLSSRARFRRRALERAMPPRMQGEDAAASRHHELAIDRGPLRAVGLPALIDAKGRRDRSCLDADRLWRQIVSPLDRDQRIEPTARGVRDALIGRLVYERIAIPKRGGGLRWLEVPSAELARAQKAIVHELALRMHPDPRAVAFVRERSPVLHAVLHAGARSALVVDIRNFFGSVSEKQLRRALCGSHRSLCAGWREEDTDLLLDLVLSSPSSRDGSRHLPQGAATSPLLANLVAGQLDRAVLAQIAKSPWASDWTYSRYADDLVITTRDERSGFFDLALHLVQREVVRRGWHLAAEKTRRWRFADGATLTLCGVQVPAQWDSRAQLPRDVRRRVRAALHAVRSDEVSKQSLGLLAYAYAVTGDHRYAAAVSSDVRRDIAKLASALGEDEARFLEDWLTK